MVAKLIPNKLVGQFFAVGSIGGSDSKAALKYVLNLTLPYWYQIPSIHEEDMIRQFAYAVEGFEDKEQFVVDLDVYTYREIVANDDPIIIDEEHAHGLYQLLPNRHFDFFKTQQTAPATMCFSTRDSEGHQLISASMFKFYTVLMRRFAEGQMKLLRPHCDQVILCQDDPALGFVIKMVQHGDVLGLDVKRIVTETERIFPKDAIPAYHYCEDWRTLQFGDQHLLWDSAPKISHIDVVAYPPTVEDTQAEQMNRFMERGGGIALGVIPNTDDAFTDSVINTLRHNLRIVVKSLQKSGINIDLLKENVMISTQCGLSRASEDLTREIHLLSPRFPEIFHECIREIVPDVS